MTLSKLIESEVADFFAGFGGPGEPDIESGEAQQQLTGRLLSLLERQERDKQEPVYQMLTGGGWFDISKEHYEGADKSRGVVFRVVYAAPPAPVVTSEPVRYMNRFTGACFTLEQQPYAATDTAVYVPLYTEQPAPVAQPAPVVPDILANAFISAIEKEQERLHGEDYLMDSRDCIDVIREELQRLNACRAAMNGATISNSADFAIVEISKVTAPVSTVVPEDYFSSLVSKARPAAEKAMRKFPQPNYVLLKVAEEAGEVVQAGVHYAEGRMSWEQVEGEIVQLLAMLFRLVTEGDQINGVTPPAHTRAVMLQSFGITEQLEPVSQPYKLVGEVVAWDHPTKERSLGFRWLSYDVAPGTKLYAMGKE